MSGLAGLTRCELTAQREVLPTISEGLPAKPDASTPIRKVGFFVRIPT